VSRDAQILHAAATLFRERGYAAVGVDEIGRAIGLTGPAIYRHFSAKEEILSTLFDQGMDEVFRVTTQHVDDPFDTLAAIAREHARHVLRNPLLAGIWIHESRSLSDAHRQRHRRRAERYIGRWTDALRRCYPGAPESATLAVAHGALGALNAVNSWPRGLRDETQVDVLVTMVLRGAEALSAAGHVDPMKRVDSP
jgi:AcrR family transcriptional regulator